jgi:hypothetical protein
VPQFAGSFVLERPVGAALSSGQRVMSDPWRATGTFRATPASAALQDVAFQYGPEERAINFSGKADLTFGDRPHFGGEIKALEVDADRALAAPDVTHRPPLLVIKNFAEAFVAAAKLPMLGEVTIAIDGLTVGGTSIRSLHGTLRFDDAGWSLDGFDLHAPGLTDISLSGRLAQTAQGLAFSGPGALESGDADMLMAWLAGRSGAPSGQSGTLKARGNVTIAGDRMAVDELTATLDQETVGGRVAYTWPVQDRPAAVDADLHATKLDLDVLTDFAKSAVGEDGLDLPRVGSLTLDIGNATLAGVDARAVKTQVKFDAGALQIEHLTIADLAGAALEVSGRIDALSSQPSGRLIMQLDSRQLAGLAGIVGKFAPQAADVFRRSPDRLSPAAVHGVLTIAPAATSGSTAKLELSGQLGLMRLTLNGEAAGEASHFGDATMRMGGRLDADDGTVLAALFGADRLLGVDQLPGRFTLSAEGPLNGDLRVDGELAASGFDAVVHGTARAAGEGAPRATLQMQAKAADLRPLQQTLTGQPGSAVPVSARADVSIAGADLSFTQIAATVGKSAVHGRLAVTLASPLGIDGDIEADGADAARVAAMLLGLPRPVPGAAELWSSQPVGAGAFAAMNGAVTFKLDHAAFMPSLAANALRGVALFGPSEIVLDDIDGTLAGGQLTGKISFRRDADGLVGHGHVELAGADAAALLQVDTKTVDAKLTFKLDGDSIGANPAALVRALHGGGTIGIADAHFAGLDAAAFPAAMRAADQANTIDAAKIQPAVNAALANGRLAVPRADAAMTLTGGKIGIANVTLQAQDGSALALAGSFDLGSGAIDARMTLSADPPANALIRTRPELGVALKGPLAAPARTLDASALTGWLALRAAELQTRRIESIEANGRKEVIGRVIRPGIPAIRAAGHGAVVEAGILEDVPPPAFGARRLDLLQPESPSAATVSTPGLTKPPTAKPAPPPAKPQTAGPDKHSPLDLLFRPQN